MIKGWLQKLKEKILQLDIKLIMQKYKLNLELEFKNYLLKLLKLY